MISELRWNVEKMAVRKEEKSFFQLLLKDIEGRGREVVLVGMRKGGAWGWAGRVWGSMISRKWTLHTDTAPSHARGEETTLHGRA